MPTCAALLRASWLGLVQLPLHQRRDRVVQASFRGVIQQTSPMTARLWGHGTSRLLQLSTTVLQLLKEQEMVFLRRPSPDPSPRGEPCSVGGRPSVQQGQCITADRSVLTRIQQPCSSTGRSTKYEVRSPKYEVRSPKSNSDLCRVGRDLCFMKFYPPGAVSNSPTNYPRLVSYKTSNSTCTSSKHLHPTDCNSAVQ